ncbi:MAG: hypothetical protein MJ144_03145, partial [Clostridia bacterium]|nr:hypothetical protein [Clostridia bacterium]
QELRNLFDYINSDRVAEDDGFIQELDDAVRIWNTGDKMDMLLTATQKDQAIKEEKARQEGIAQGIAEGKKEKAIEDARAFAREGVSADVISRCTGLTVEEVNAL